MFGRFYLFYLAVIFIFIAGFSVNIQKRYIRTQDSDIHFYVIIADKKRVWDIDKEYCWYKSGEIHCSYGDAAGNLLHGEYIKYYFNNQLAEKGNFHYGLKKGVWRKWHPNGVLQEQQSWYKGRKRGNYILYDNQGKVEITGNYKKNKKEGIWVNHKAEDTLWYVKGISYNEEPKIAKAKSDSMSGKKYIHKKDYQRQDTIKVKSDFFKRIFGQKDTLNTKNDSFLKRLFNKKEK